MNRPAKPKRSAFEVLGPGLVTGAADDDPSGIGTYSQVGVGFGEGLLEAVQGEAQVAAGVGVGLVGPEEGGELFTAVRPFRFQRQIRQQRLYFGGGKMERFSRDDGLHGAKQVELRSGHG